MVTRTRGAALPTACAVGQDACQPLGDADVPSSTLGDAALRKLGPEGTPRSAASTLGAPSSAVSNTMRRCFRQGRSVSVLPDDRD